MTWDGWVQIAPLLTAIVTSVVPLVLLEVAAGKSVIPHRRGRITSSDKRT